MGFRMGYRTSIFCKKTERDYRCTEVVVPGVLLEQMGKVKAGRHEPIRMISMAPPIDWR